MNVAAEHFEAACFAGDDRRVRDILLLGEIPRPLRRGGAVLAAARGHLNVVRTLVLGSRVAECGRAAAGNGRAAVTAWLFALSGSQAADTLLCGALLVRDAELIASCRKHVDLPIAAEFAACCVRGDRAGARDAERIARRALGGDMLEKFYTAAFTGALYDGEDALARRMLRAATQLRLKIDYSAVAERAVESGALRVLRTALRRGGVVASDCARALALRVRGLLLRRDLERMSLRALGPHGREHATCVGLVYALALRRLPHLDSNQRYILTREAFWGAELSGPRCTPYAVVNFDIRPSVVLSLPTLAQRILRLLSFSGFAGSNCLMASCSVHAIWILK